ncbi:ATP-grasp domain-containing protein [Solirubrobacter ginsenosidimutans]|nr:ATP-grasp domain-containing protein [Solirubrobacter ginsenosidimutans]
MLADLAQRDGRPVLAFDLFGDLDLRRRADRVMTAGRLSALVDAAIAEPPGHVVYGASFENHPALVARLAERHALLGNAPGTLRAVRDPARLGATLRDAGFAFPRTCVTAPEDRSGRWLRKPLRGGGGTRVRGWRGGVLPAGTFVQERVDGLGCSAVAVGDGVDAVVLGLTEQLVGERAFGVRGYRWCGNLTPPRLPAGELEALLGQAHAICSHLAAAFALRGAFGVDFIWDSERAWTHEVNPRPTASLEAIESAYGVGVFDAHLRGCAGELPHLAATRSSAAAKAVLFATENVTIGDSERWLRRGVRDVPHPGERISAGHPICTVVATAATPQPALEAVQEHAARVRAELRVEVPADG